jgi:CheY-like chemotaxis protein
MHFCLRTRIFHSNAAHPEFGRNTNENLLLSSLFHTILRSAKFHVQGCVVSGFGARSRNVMTHTILYAEDDPNDIALVQVAFQVRSDLDFQFVRDGIEALNYVFGRDKFADRRVYPLPNLILLDLKMPRLSGFDALAFLQKHPAFAAIPVVVLSSSDQQSDIDQAYQLGASAYVVKPSAFVQLQSILIRTVDFFLVQSLNSTLPHETKLPPEIRSPAES